MGTSQSDDSVGTVLFGKTQRALLALFFLRPDESFYLRQIVRTAGVGQGAVQRELAHWVDSGIVVRTRRGNQVYFQANRASPVFEELRSLTVKTTGVVDVIRDALANLAERITVAFIHGSFASGRNKTDSDVDVVVIGAVSFGDVTDATRAAQTMLGREVNPTVYPSREIRAKLRAKQHFVTSLLTTPKIYLIGGEREFKRLVT